MPRTCRQTRSSHRRTRIPSVAAQDRRAIMQFGMSVGRTASDANNAVQALLGVVTLAATGLAWWRFGAAWGLVVFLACLCGILVVTGVRPQKKLDGSAVAGSCHLQDLEIRRRTATTDPDLCESLDISLRLRNMGSTRIEYSLKSLMAVAGTADLVNPSVILLPAWWHVIHPGNTDDFIVPALTLQSPTTGTISGTLQYTLVYRPFGGDAQYEQHNELRFENVRLVGTNQSHTTRWRDGEFYDRAITP